MSSNTLNYETKKTSLTIADQPMWSTRIQMCMYYRYLLHKLEAQKKNTKILPIISCPGLVYGSIK